MEPISSVAEPPPASRRDLDGALMAAGLGLAVVAVLYEVLAVGAGLAFQARQFPGDPLHRIGFVAASAVDLRLGLGLVLAAALAAAARPAATSRLAGGLVLAASAAAVALALLALRAQYHQLDLRRTDPSAAFHLSQATYLVGAIGPAVVAVVVVVRGVFAADGRQ